MDVFRSALGPVAVVLTIFLAPLQPRAAQADSGHCVVVDTDSAIDDLRAIAALINNEPVVGIVTTEGASNAFVGAAIVERFVADASVSRPPAVIVGASRAAGDAWTPAWLPAVRERSERLRALLGNAIPASRANERLEDRIEQLLKNCPTVDVIVIGPWTSFATYGPVMRKRIGRVIAQGRHPVADDPPGSQVSFNCRYDIESCEAAAGWLTLANVSVWVDVADNANNRVAEPIDLTPVHPADNRTMLQALRALYRFSPEWWRHAPMKDDAVAIYYIYATEQPFLFERRGQHYEPRFDSQSDTLLLCWLKAVGAGGSCGR